MITLKIVPILALAMGLSTFAFAGDKSAKADNSKADNTATAKVEAAATPTQADAKADEDAGPYYYKVTALNKTTHQYSIMQETALQNDCPGDGQDACEFTSPTTLSSPINQSTVDGGSGGIVVNGTRQF